MEREKQEAIKNAMTEVQACKDEYEKKEKELAMEQDKVKKAREDAETVKSNPESQILFEMIQINQDREKRMKKVYEAKKKALYGSFLGVLLYAILITVFTAVRSEIFVSDFKTFFATIWSLLCLCVEKLLKMANFASQVGNKIPQEIIALIVHWVILIVVFVLVAGGVGTLIVVGMINVYRFYKKNDADLISLVFILVSFAAAVFFAEPIRTVIPVNLLLALILIHVLYMGVRWCIKKFRQK